MIDNKTTAGDTSERNFPSGTALMLLLSLSRHEFATAKTMQREIRSVSKVELSLPGVSSTLKHLLALNYIERRKFVREGDIRRGQHKEGIHYRLSPTGGTYLDWMLMSIDMLRE